MTAQSDLLFALPPEPTATIARDKAIDRVERANRSWVAVASRIICELSKSREEFSSDDVLPLLGGLGAPSDPRALGAAFKASARAGFIEPTSRFEKTKRVSRHAAPIRIWRRRREAA